MHAQVRPAVTVGRGRERLRKRFPFESARRGRARGTDGVRTTLNKSRVMFGLGLNMGKWRRSCAAARVRDASGAYLMARAHSQEIRPPLRAI